MGGLKMSVFGRIRIYTHVVIHPCGTCTHVHAPMYDVHRARRVCRHRDEPAVPAHGVHRARAELTVFRGPRARIGVPGHTDMPDTILARMLIMA